MTIAHLILAHHAPAQLTRLAWALDHPHADIFIHLDQKADYRPFAPLAGLPHVRFTRCRFDVKWGGYSLTQAALEGMREILQAPEHYDFINLLSGDDYPIKPVEDIHRFLEQHAGHSFVEGEPDSSAWWQANRSRADQYHLTEFSFPGRYHLQRWLNWLLPRRKQRLLTTLYGGNMGGWYTLTRQAAAYIVDFVDANPSLRRYAYYTWGSDEFLVPSILLNSPLAATVINNNLRYIDWSAGGASPQVLTAADLPALDASYRLYARKFDIRRDAAVLDQLDQRIAEQVW